MGSYFQFAFILDHFLFDFQGNLGHLEFHDFILQVRDALQLHLLSGGEGGGSVFPGHLADSSALSPQLLAEGGGFIFQDGYFIVFAFVFFGGYHVHVCFQERVYYGGGLLGLGTFHGYFYQFGVVLRLHSQCATVYHCPESLDHAGGVCVFGFVFGGSIRSGPCCGVDYICYGEIFCDFLQHHVADDEIGLSADEAFIHGYGVVAVKENARYDGGDANGGSGFVVRLDDDPQQRQADYANGQKCGEYDSPPTHDCRKQGHQGIALRCIGIVELGNMTLNGLKLIFFDVSHF